MIEWPEGDAEPLKYFLSTAPEDATIEQIVFVTKMRWQIERDYQELKQEFGLGHYEGRGWRVFHHHATLCIAAYGFLTMQHLKDPGVKKKYCGTKSAWITQRLRRSRKPDERSVMYLIPLQRCARTSLVQSRHNYSVVLAVAACRD